MKRSPLTPDSSRRGLTLFEVLISLAIFVGAMAALGQLVANGVRGAVQSQLMTQAVMRCEAKLSEMVAGVEALSSASNQPFDDDPAWIWSTTVGSGPVAGLLLIEVTVDRPASNGTGKASFTLRRYMRDPQVYVAAAEAEAAAVEADASAAGNSGTNSGGTGGGTPTGR